MKRILTYFTLLLIAALIGIAVNKHSGYVLIAYNNVTIETTLWFAVILVFLVFIIAYGLLCFIYKLSRLPHNVEGFIKQYHNNKARCYFMDGLQKLLEGDWVKAEKLIAQSIKHETEITKKIIQKETAKQDDMPLLNYLAASYAVNKQQNYNQRNYYLNTAQKLYSNNRKALFTIELCRLRLLLQSKQNEEASALLHHLINDYRKHKRLLQNIQITYFGKQGKNSNPKN